MKKENIFHLDTSLKRQLEELLVNNISAYRDQLCSEFSNYHARDCEGSCKGGCSCKNGGTMTIG